MPSEMAAPVDVREFRFEERPFPLRHGRHAGFIWRTHGDRASRSDIPPQPYPNYHGDRIADLQRARTLRKEDVDLANKLIFIADSKTPTGVAEVPLTDIAVEAFRSQIEDRWPRTVVVSKFEEPRRVSDELQEDLGESPPQGRASVVPAVRSPLHSRDPAQRGGCCGRVGHANATPDRRQGF
jgi:integrase